MISAAVYGDFHPSGRYAVFSSNIIIPAFHAQGSKRLEVYDTESDLAIADLEQNRMILSPLTRDKKYWKLSLLSRRRKTYLLLLGSTNHVAGQYLPVTLFALPHRF